jgi:hypothetical protein
VYAFSRIDRDERVEYIVALNNSERASTVDVPTYAAGRTRFQLVGASSPRRGGASSPKTGPNGSLAVTVPALGYVVYRATAPVPASTAAPAVDIVSLEHGDTAVLGMNSWDGHQVRDRIEVAAELDRDVLAEVTFAVRVGDGDYEPIGTDDNAPYRVFYDASHLEGAEPTTLSFRAIVNDLSGHLAADAVANVAVEFETPQGDAGYAVVHYARPAGDYGDHTTGNSAEYWGLHLWGDGLDPSEVTEWTSPKPFIGEDEYGRFAFIRLADASSPVNFIVHRGDAKDPDNSPDRSFDPAVAREIWLRAGDPTVYTSQAAAEASATVHYECVDCSAVTMDGSPPTTTDTFGAVFEVAVADPSAPVTVTIANGGVVDVDAQAFTPAQTPTVWFNAGDQTAYPSRGAAQDFVLVHYHRPDGEYGDAASPDYNDFWGMHVWEGAVAPTDWTSPVRPSGTDTFGVTYRAEVVDGADQLAYILHRGDAKDPGPDQFLVFASAGHEVWQVQGADPDNPYVLTR